jgi:hypothetical protein
MTRAANISQLGSTLQNNLGSGNLILASTTNMIFDTNNGNANGAMFIDVNGNVGINTTVPLSNFSVSGNVAISGNLTTQGVTVPNLITMLVYQQAL